MTFHPTFKRAQLAQSFCDSLSGQGIANSTSGLFLAGPRRVGKSTFLVEDLMPASIERGWFNIYVDLWSNKKADPGLLLIEAIKSAIAEHKTLMQKWLKNIRKVSVLKTVEFDLSKPGLPEGLTVVDLLKDLSKTVDKPILLLIDEAQHALTSDDGLNTMFSLKSARDQLNIGYDVPNLMLVFTGSNRDKLAQLVIKKESPFFGSDITPFPLLGKPFTDDFTDFVNKSLSQENQFDKDDMFEVFKLVGYRPEVLRQLVGQLAITHNAVNLSQKLKQDASIWHGNIWSEYERDYENLSSIQQAILQCMVSSEEVWSPFSDKSQQFYEQAVAGKKVPTSTIQTAIAALRENGFIWQSSRGGYALEDESFGEWLKSRN